MANPEYPVQIKTGQWNLVAENITSGTLWPKTKCDYLQTYREYDANGVTKPTDADEGVKMFVGPELYESVSNSTAINVYVWPSKDATMRVDV